MSWKWEGGRELISSFPKAGYQDIVGRQGKGWCSLIGYAVDFWVAFLLFSNRRELGNIDEVRQISLEDALSSEEVEVAFICSESSSHEDYIRWVFNVGGPYLAQQSRSIKMTGQTEIS